MEKQIERYTIVDQKECDYCEHDAYLMDVKLLCKTCYTLINNELSDHVDTLLGHKPDSIVEKLKNNIAKRIIDRISLEYIEKPNDR